MVPVSICLTTWNRASVLPRTLDSLLEQTFSDFELIVSDDCSTDETEEVCRTYVQRDSRVRFFRNDRNLGMPGNLNAAIQRATGYYIANAHDGDVYRADLIAKWKEALDTVPTAAFVFNDYEAILPDGARRVYGLPFDLRVPGEEIALHYFRTVTSCVWGTVMARSSAYSRAGLFDPSLGFISDVDMWLRLTYEADASYVNEPLITLGLRPEDRSLRRDPWREAFWAFRIYVSHLRSYRHKLPRSVNYYRSVYPDTLRRYFLRSLLWCLKQRRWKKVQEGLAIWQDAGDPVLRRMGHLLSIKGWRPAWYDPSWWAMTHLTVEEG
jgi:glycosyltransferase involved in cell wall biosynthesis